jgi:hypothetical protein
VPSDTPARFKQALFPIGKWHQICWCQTLILSLARHHFCCHAAGCYLFRSAIPLLWGLMKHPPSITALVCVRGLLCGYVGSMATGTGAENLYRSILKSFESTISSYRTLFCSAHSGIHAVQGKLLRANHLLSWLIGGPKTHSTFYLVIATGRCELILDSHE